MQKIKPYARVRSYKKGSNLFFQGEAPSRGIMITDGFVRAYSIASNGEEQTISFFSIGDIIPLSWFMQTTTTSLFYYEALTDVRALQFLREDLEEHVLSDPLLLRQMYQTIGKDYTAAMLRINGLEQSRAEEKVSYTLYYLLFRYGEQQKNSSLYTIPITLRHTTIASLIGLSREGTTKILGKLQQQQIISYDHGTYTIDKVKLENYIGEDVFRDFSL